MELLPLNRLGAREVAGGQLEFGVLLPWVSAADGNRLWVKVIHEADQFIQDVPPTRVELHHSVDPTYGDYWSTTVDLGAAGGGGGSHWGEPGRYVYRYALERPDLAGELDWVIDPYAREFGVGKLSAITVGYQAHQWSAGEAAWRVPALDDLVMYELMINEFGGSVDGAIDRLPYLADLGVNCIEVMPVSNVSHVIDWGFLPIGYFGVDERLGNRKHMQRLIEAAHELGMAVILDVVYGHTSSDFAYSSLYRRLNYHENPFMGSFAKDYFGESTDFRRKLTRDFFFTVNHHWLATYHADGFRYDCVPNYWDGAVGQGYANLTWATYGFVKNRRGGGGHWDRFFDDDGSSGGAGDGTVNLIQCAEQLEGPVEILDQTYSNCTWQNETLGAAQGAARGSAGALTDLGLRLGLMGYPASRTVDDDTIPKTALQYVENHDHSRFVCNFGTTAADNDLLREGLRDNWWKVQPYLIAMMTGRGIPMLWQGQELGENYFVPESGFGRVALFRPVRWDYFYDHIGRAAVTLVRKLVALRRQLPQLRGGDHFFHNDPGRYQDLGVLVFTRRLDDALTVVALNFGEADQTVPFTFAVGGKYREELHGHDLGDVADGQERWLTVPSNYGRIWTRT
ncbi:MAG TPA: alpha-amylase family glycosyl hydrolase [Acidimicrobiales bacterium]|nr:alpha-amylase family glycosyl hydrolase [Acidimicrobiales bacterium]